MEFELKDGDSNKIALVIMQNPSRATKEISDHTINTVLDRLHKFNYSKVSIVNLIPIYGTKSGSISKLADTIEDDIYINNDKIITQEIDKASKIFVAWGGCNDFNKCLYENRISSIYKLLKGKEVYCYKTNKDGKPIHPSRNGWPKEAGEGKYVKYIFKNYD